MVNAISPGWVDTQMSVEGIDGIAKATGKSKEATLDEQMRVVPLRKMSEPREVAGLVRYLVSESQVSITGRSFDFNNWADGLARLSSWFLGTKIALLPVAFNHATEGIPMAKRLNKTPSTSTDAQPVTRKMLQVVRREVKSEIRALSLKMDSKFKELDSKFFNIDSRFTSIDSRFIALDSRFLAIDSRFSEQDSKFLRIESKLEDMSAKIERSNLLFEEQNSNNRIVLDGLQALWQRQTRLEQRLP